MAISSENLPFGEITPPDWSQFFPDTISSLATSALVGLVVGILLWRWQTKSEQRVLRRVALAEWRTKRPIVGNAVAPVVNREMNSRHLPEHVKFFESVLRQGQSMPVGEWVDAAPDNAELRAFAELLVDLPTLGRFATDLNQRMEQALLRDGLVMDGYQGPFVAWASAAVLELSDPSRIVGDGRDQFRATALMMLAYPDIAAKVTEFRNLLAKVEVNYNGLQSALTIGV